MKAFIIAMGLMFAVNLLGEPLQPNSPYDVLIVDPLRLLLTSVPKEKANDIESATIDWFTRADIAPIAERAKLRDHILKLLYAGGSPSCLAFADSFFADGAMNPNRPHPETPSELILSIVFIVPKTADWGTVNILSKDDMRDTLPGMAATKTIRLRKLLGLPEIPLLELYKSFPREREKVMPWILSLARDGGLNEAEITKIQDAFSILQKGSDQPSLAIPTSTRTPQIRQSKQEGQNEHQASNGKLESKSKRSMLLVLLLLAGLGLWWWVVTKRK